MSYRLRRSGKWRLYRSWGKSGRTLFVGSFSACLRKRPAIERQITRGAWQPAVYLQALSPYRVDLVAK